MLLVFDIDEELSEADWTKRTPDVFDDLPKADVSESVRQRQLELFEHHGPGPHESGSSQDVHGKGGKTTKNVAALSRKELSEITLYHASFGDLEGEPRPGELGFFLASSPDKAKKGGQAGHTFPMLGISSGTPDTVTEFKVSPSAKVFGKDVYLKDVPLPERMTVDEFNKARNVVKMKKWDTDPRVQKEAAKLASMTFSQAYEDVQEPDGSWYAVKTEVPTESRGAGYKPVDFTKTYGQSVKKYIPDWDGFEMDGGARPKAIRAIGFDVAFVADEAGISVVALTEKALTRSVKEEMHERCKRAAEILWEGYP